MDYLLVFFSVICLVAGFLGCLLPVLPGPPLSFLALVLLHITKFAHFTARLLVVLAVLTVIIQILDYIVPVWGTKKFGGTRAGIRGSTIGLIIGIIILPVLGITIGPFGLIGILGGPFLGAYLGESLAGQGSEKAFRAAWGSFIGFLAGTFMKLALASVMMIYYIREIFIYFKQ